MSTPLDFLIDNLTSKSTNLAQATTKIKMFGLNHVMSGKTRTARDQLQANLTELIAAVDYLNLELAIRGHEQLSFENDESIDREIHRIEHLSKIAMREGALRRPLPFFQTDTPRTNGGAK